jgi:GWxTD domain-containing protein
MLIFGQKTKKPIHNEQLNFHSQVYYKSNEATLFFSIAEYQLLKKKNPVSDIFEHHFTVDISIDNSNKDIFSKEYQLASSTDLMNSIVDSFIIGARISAFDYEITITDLNKNQFNFLDIEVDPNLNFGTCYFLKRNQTGTPILSNHHNQKAIQLCSNKYKNQAIRCFQFNNSQTAPPPFVQLSGSVNLGSADSVFQIPFDPNGQAIIENLDGLLILSSNRLDLSDYFFLYSVDDLFPFFKSHAELIEPIKFISSRDEYTQLKNAVNPKEAFENFWIELGGDKTRAKELIREFYSRVKHANTHFSSYKKGWKTDRGIMYIIFGEPELVDVNGKEIKWTYSSKFDSRTSMFSFYQSLSNISNDFELVRNPLFKSGWYLALETWRNGQVYQK